MKAKIQYLIFMIMLSVVYLNVGATVDTDKIRFDNVSTITAKTSVKEPGMAEVVLPRNIRQAQNNILDYLNAGDRIEIQMGYNGTLRTEFTGYIKSINAGPPVTLVCDDEMYKLRQSNYVLSYKAVTLDKLMTDIVTPLGIKVETIGSLNLGKFVVDKASAYDVLDRLKSDYGLYSDFTNGLLRVGFAYDYTGFNNHTVTIGKDVKDYGNLTFVRSKDYELQIQAIANKANGSKIKVSIPDKVSGNATVRTLNFGDMPKDELTKVAKAKYETLNFDGYQGSITLFGVPEVEAGDNLTINDINETDRNGTYLVEAVEKRLGGNYIERICTIANKV